MKNSTLPSLEVIHAARQRLSGEVLRTPLVRFEARASDFINLDSHQQDRLPEIFLKLENLQPTGSFKVRGAGNALLSTGSAQCKQGVWTASAGNMGQALAWYARKLNILCTVVVPDDAPQVKVNAIERLGARVEKKPFSEYQAIQRDGGHPDMKGLLVHPFADEVVMAGNGVIGLEILEDLPDVDVVFVPYGGGGLSCGIAASITASHSEARVLAVEAATATPLTSSLKAGMPVEVPFQPSFVSGMGAPFVFPQMWPLASQILHGSRVVDLAQIAGAIRLLAERHHIIVEAAGAVGLAAALSQPIVGKAVCVVSGGNIAAGHLIKILQGEMP